MTAQGTTQVENPKVNGVNVGQVMKVIGSVQDKPENAQFQFRLNNRWVDGGLNRSQVKGYFADGREHDTRSEAFVVDADEPAITAGGDSAPNPMEFVLHSLAAA